MTRDDFIAGYVIAHVPARVEAIQERAEYARLQLQETTWCPDERAAFEAKLKARLNELLPEAMDEARALADDMERLGARFEKADHDET